eukprot:m.3246 g.3246  ORF g.3246 m.3246 type:complete len:680 (+) comp9180_c0_seq1:77-2116(+)
MAVLFRTVLLLILVGVAGASEELYQRAIKHYLAEEWQQAIDAFESALAEYETWKDDVLTCFKTCGNEPWETNEENVELKTVESLLEMSDCPTSCSIGRALKRDSRREFESRLPYHYLQFSYYKAGNLKRAVEAAYTYLEAHHDDKVMKNNIMYYEGMTGFSPAFAVSMEASHRLSLYQKGVVNYEEKECRESVTYFEAALQAYYKAVELCQALCQISPLGKGIKASKYSPIGAVGKLLKDLIKCRLNCSLEAGYVTEHSDQAGYEGIHYHYLQFCYFQLGLLKDAQATALAYLHLKPNDPVMQGNVEYYKSQVGIVHIQPRKEILYMKARDREQQLLTGDSVADTSDTSDAEVSSEALGPPPVLFLAEQQSSKPRKISTRKIRTTFNEDDEDESPVENDSYHATANNWTIDYDEASKSKRDWDSRVSVLLPPSGQEELERVVAEGLLNEEECKELIQLANAGAKGGDGYAKNTHPHTQHEKFEGLDILNAAQSAETGLLNATSSELYFDSAEKGRDFVEKYFQLKSKLYMTYTHLVCRTSLEREGRDVKELSHPVHSDNCIIRKNGQECKKEAPAYTWRDYSAILYLNDDFEGGDFFWAHKNLTIATTVRPKCGRLVGFDGGHYHGVTGIAAGKRYAIALWFTLDHKHEEVATQKATEIFKKLRQSSDDDDRKEKHSEF